MGEEDVDVGAAGAGVDEGVGVAEGIGVDEGVGVGVGEGVGAGVGVGGAAVGNLATKDVIDGEHRSGDREARVGGLVAVGEGVGEFE